MDYNGRSTVGMDSSEEVEPSKCVFCDRMLAVFGVALGLVFLYISIDILTGQKLTGMLSGGTRAEVIESE